LLTVNHPDPRDVVLPFEAFPPTLAVVAEPEGSCGEILISGPTVTLLCCQQLALWALKLAISVVPKDP
jgi:hypothetical protein